MGFNDRLERPNRLLGWEQDVAGVFAPLTIQSTVRPRSRPKERPPGIRVYRIIYSRFPSNLKTAYDLLIRLVGLPRFELGTSCTPNKRQPSIGSMELL